MNQLSPARPIEFYQALPKVDLHRHLEGSLRLRTIMEVGRSHGLDLLGTDRLRPLVQIGENEPLTSQNFLSKFETLRQFYLSPDVIGRITREAICDAAADNVRYLELRFTPAALVKTGNFSLEEGMDWVIQATHEAEAEYGIRVRLIASVNRHESPELAAEVIRLVIERRDQGIVGIDLAGNEVNFPAGPFIEFFQEASQNGLQVTAHAGEWGGAGNVASAIMQLAAKRIGHGVRVLEDPAVVALAREREITFEVCITSNYQSGVIPALSIHPLRRMLSAGLDVTINSDDPSISQITLSDEYRTACEQLGLSLETIRQRVLSAAAAAFLPAEERKELGAALEAEFPQSS